MKTEIEKQVLEENNISAKRGNTTIALFVFAAAAVSLCIALFLDSANEAQMSLYLIAAILAVAGVVKYITTPAVLLYEPTKEILSKYEFFYEQSKKNTIVEMLNKGEIKTLEKEGKNRDNLPIKLTVFETESKSIALCRLYQFIPYTFEPISELKIIKKE